MLGYLFTQNTPGELALLNIVRKKVNDHLGPKTLGIQLMFEIRQLAVLKMPSAFSLLGNSCRQPARLAGRADRVIGSVKEQYWQRA